MNIHEFTSVDARSLNASRIEDGISAGWLILGGRFNFRNAIVLRRFTFETSCELLERLE